MSERSLVKGLNRKAIRTLITLALLSSALLLTEYLRDEGAMSFELEGMSPRAARKIENSPWPRMMLDTIITIIEPCSPTIVRY